MCVTCGCSDDAEVTLTHLPSDGSEAISSETLPHEHTHTLPDGTVMTHTHHRSHSQAAEHHSAHHTHHHSTHHYSAHHNRHSEHFYTHLENSFVQQDEARIGSHAHSDSHPHTYLQNGSSFHHFAKEQMNGNGDKRKNIIFSEIAEPNMSKSAQLHAQMHSTTVTLEQNILAKNDRIAAENRGWLKGRNTLAFNLVSSPGSGKTTLLVRTIRDLKNEMTISVIEGDQATANDANRIRETGCPVVQINTGTGCHLEAAMVERGLQRLNPPLDSVVMIENVGNLVCPALFDLGERAKIVILSVTEGEDKPIKYPHMFRASEIMILTKIDLLPYVQFDVKQCIQFARQVNPNIQVFQVSATSGEGLDDWYGWLRELRSTAVLTSEQTPHK